MASIISSVCGPNVVFQVADAGGCDIPRDRWASEDVSGIAEGVAILESQLQSGLAVAEPQGAISMPADRVALLDDDRASALGLPSPVPYTLELEARGSLGSMVLSSWWIGADQLRVKNARVLGPIMTVDGTLYRVASPLYEILQLVDAFNAAGKTGAVAQAAQLAELKELIGIEPDLVDLGRFLDRLRVARANRFSLDFTRDESGGFQVAPVPMAVDRRVPSAITSVDESTAESQNSVRLLSAEHQEAFQRAFRGRRDVQSAYLGGSYTYVVLSPDVRKSLEVVRAVQDRPIADRIAFAKNPYIKLRELFPSETTPPFVESRAFSERVIGLGRPERIVLPWQSIASNGWLPPEFVRITLGAQSYNVPPDAIDPGIADLEYGMATRASSVSIAGNEIEPTPEALEAFIAVRKVLDERASVASIYTEHDDDLMPKNAADRIGLIVKKNLEGTEFEAPRQSRRAASRELPEIVTLLKKHQVTAVNWLQNRWLGGYRGALLADDMGLGKSLTTLMFMMWLRSEMQRGTTAPRPMLVVAPLSLLDNWEKEHKQHVGASSVAFVDIQRGSGSALAQHRKFQGRDINEGAAVIDVNSLTTDRFNKPTLVLTTYESLRDYQHSFASIQFGLVVLDEVQRVKDPSSLAYSAVSALNADFWVALTGTPVENRLADLWAIADIIEPGFLEPLRNFSTAYETVVDETKLRVLKKKLEESLDDTAFMMRRMKEHVLDGIPQKHEHVRARSMPPVQEFAYNDIVDASRDVKSRGKILEVIQELRNVSLHPLKPSEAGASEFIRGSARFQALFDILDKVSQLGDKVLIFVDRNALEPYLAKIIQQRYDLPSLPSIINGEVPGARRQSLVDAFQAQQGFSVMLLSPKAGGVGLTITAANHVIHLSRWWNPAVEDQATDRVYRIGQRKPVHVYYLQSVLEGRPGDSFDEKLDLLLRRKRRLSRELLWPNADNAHDAAFLLGHEVQLSGSKMRSRA